MSSIPALFHAITLCLLMLGSYLDAKRKGGIARFVNHSCEPTCRLEQWTAMGQPRCAVFALRDMSAGEVGRLDYWNRSVQRAHTVTVSVMEIAFQSSYLYRFFSCYT